jgi:ATP-dependent DNA helicase PIF1
MEDNNLSFAWERLHDLTTHTLLTGDAGTGKSTLIRKFIEANQGECVVLAPTGIAAVNIGGQTIHSFFHFPGRPIAYNAVKWLNLSLPGDEMKMDIIKKAKYFIIDEVSMVRSDLMDQIEWFFYKNFSYGPIFAGKKLIMVGDLDQLPPVVKEGPEREMISARYKSEFFFHAACWNPSSERHASFEVVKLTKVWRQSDPVFVKLLNDIKTNKISPFDIDNLNRRCYKDGTLKPEDGIVLCSTNAIANEINAEMLSRLEEKEIILHGEIKGSFNEKDCTVEKVITLKIGCRVMVMVNSRGIDRSDTYMNGEIGVLEGLNYNESFEGEEGGFSLKIKLDNGNIVYVGKNEFESIEYTYNKADDKISHNKTGTFIQYPVKVAYAITVHKSQGQTFDKVIVDLGERGAFAHGQTYVALSRCRSLDGLILRRNIQQKDLIYNKNILEFNKLISA